MRYFEHTGNCILLVLQLDSVIFQITKSALDVCAPAASFSANVSPSSVPAATDVDVCASCTASVVAAGTRATELAEFNSCLAAWNCRLVLRCDGAWCAATEAAEHWRIRDWETEGASVYAWSGTSRVRRRCFGAAAAAHRWSSGVRVLSVLSALCAQRSIPHTSRYFVLARLQAPARTSASWRNFYEGGFESEMNKTEAAKILGCRYVLLAARCAVTRLLTRTTRIAEKTRRRRKSWSGIA